MRAVLSEQPGGPDSLIIGELPSPVAKAGEVVVSVKAAGVNFPDSLVIEDRYQYKPPRPFAPGSEMSGVVKSVGEGVTRFKPGDRVIGTLPFGCMVEELALPQHRVVMMPPSMSFEEAATFFVTYGTSHYALKFRGELKPGEKLLVLGAAGGVGVAAVELGKAMGAEVIAACSSQEKVDFAISKGADKGIVYARELNDKAAQKAFSDQIKAASDGGVDVIYDGVGGAYAEPALRALNWYGRFLVVGFPAGIPSIPLNLTLLKSCDIRGIFWGAWLEKNPDEKEKGEAELSALYEAGKIRPHISARFPMEQAADALKELTSRRATGKIVLTME